MRWFFSLLLLALVIGAGWWMWDTSIAYAAASQAIIPWWEWIVMIGFGFVLGVWISWTQADWVATRAARMAYAKRNQRLDEREGGLLEQSRALEARQGEINRIRENAKATREQADLDVAAARAEAATVMARAERLIAGEKKRRQNSIQKAKRLSGRVEDLQRQLHLIEFPP